MLKDRIFPIDGNKLDKELAKRGESAWNVSSEIGFAHTYLSCCKSRGRISQHSMLLLERMYGIKYDDVKPDESKPERKAEKEKVTQTVMALDAGADVKALTQAVTQLCAILKASYEAEFEHHQRMEQMLQNALQPETLYKSLFMPVYNAMKAAGPGVTTNERRIDGTPTHPEQRRFGT